MKSGTINLSVGCCLRPDTYLKIVKVAPIVHLKIRTQIIFCYRKVNLLLQTPFEEYHMQRYYTIFTSQKFYNLNVNKEYVF